MIWHSSSLLDFTGAKSHSLKNPQAEHSSINAFDSHHWHLLVLLMNYVHLLLWEDASNTHKPTSEPKNIKFELLLT